MQEINIFEEFGLSAKEAAVVIAKIASAMNHTRNRRDIVDFSGDTEDEKIFAAFLIGLWNGMNLCRLNPEAVEYEISYLGKLIALTWKYSPEEIAEMIEEDVKMKY